MSFEELLIGEVQRYECLHNPSSPNYNNALMTERAWQSISFRLDIPGDLCRKRWRTLRKNYKQRKKRLQLFSGRAAEDAKSRWKYFQQLSFLDNDDSTKAKLENTVDVELPEAASSDVNPTPNTPLPKPVEILSKVQDNSSKRLAALRSIEEQYGMESSSSIVKFMIALDKRIERSGLSEQEIAQLAVDTTNFVFSKLAVIKYRLRGGNGIMNREFN